MALGVVPVAHAEVAVPTDVAAALATFPTAPQAATTAWVNWAKNQSMTTASVAVDAKNNCRIDAKGVSKCTLYVPKVPGKGWVRYGVTYTLANDRTQIFKSKGKWVKNEFGADINPFTNTSRFYPYDYWLPWLTAGVPVTTSVDANGWYVVRSQNVTPGDDQLPVTAVMIAPDGLHAKFLQQYQDGKVASTQTITLRDVPAIKVPQAVKQKM